MPHDLNGNPLKPGDEVLLRAKVREITSAGENHCNVILDLLGPESEYLPQIACNSKLAQLGGAAVPAPTLPPAPPTEVPEYVRQTKEWRKRLDAVIQVVRIAATREEMDDAYAQAGVIGKEMEVIMPSSCERTIACVRIDQASQARSNRDRAIVALTEAVMWLGMDLKQYNEANPGTAPNPYPESKDPNSAKIEPTADGLKL